MASQEQVIEILFLAGFFEGENALDDDEDDKKKEEDKQKKDKYHTNGIGLSINGS